MLPRGPHKKTPISPVNRPISRPAPWHLVIEPMKLTEILNKKRRNDEDEKRVSVGDQVTLFYEDDRTSCQFKVVSANLASPEKGHISYLSPLGAEIFGRRVGEHLCVELFGRSHSFILIDLEKCK